MLTDGSIVIFLPGMMTIAPSRCSGKQTDDGNELDRTEDRMTVRHKEEKREKERDTERE